MLRHIGVCVLALALLAGPAKAADADLPPPDPADAIYTITLEADIPNTARCLDDVSKAVCAMETYIACHQIAQFRTKLNCAEAGYKPPPPPTGEIKRMLESRPKDTKVYRQAFYYRINFAYWPRPEQVMEMKERTVNEGWIENGDAIIEVQFDYCIVPNSQDCDPRVTQRRLFSLFRNGSDWTVRGWRLAFWEASVRRFIGLPD